MTKKKPSYSIEFKNKAASLVLEKNYSIPEACNAMGIGYTAIKRRVKLLESERSGVTPGSKAMISEQQKIQQLEARIKRKAHLHELTPRFQTPWV